MVFTDAGTPPSSIRDYIEDMLQELADLAERVQEPQLAASIRTAGVLAAGINAALVAERLRQPR
jgi:hypothetical protein